MRFSTFAMTLMITLAVWIFAAPIMTGCGDDRISDSNTNNVENMKRNSVNTDSSSGYVSMEEIKNAVIDILGENYWPDKQLTAKELETETGIKEEMYEEYLAEKLNVETDIDTMVIIRAKQEYLPEIETLLNEYRESLMVLYRERPQELGKAKASRIEMIDNYICFVQLGADTEAAAKEGDEEVIKWCQQENERALDVIEKTIFLPY